jgi:poly(3-hydroxybutyrate) depolymerase
MAPDEPAGDAAVIVGMVLPAEAGRWADEACYARAALDGVLDSMAADDQRVSVTGISMGEHAALLIASDAPACFRAIAAIWGWGTAYMAERLRHTCLAVSRRRRSHRAGRAFAR